MDLSLWTSVAQLRNGGINSIYLITSLPAESLELYLAHSTCCRDISWQYPRTLRAEESPVSFKLLSYLPNYVMIKRKTVYSESCTDATEESLELLDTLAPSHDSAI